MYRQKCPRLREEASRRAAERAAKQAAEAARRREEQLRQGQVAFRGRLKELKKEVAAFDGTPASRHVAESLRQLQARHAQIEQRTPGNEEDLARAEKDLRRLRREIEQTVAQGEATERVSFGTRGGGRPAMETSSSGRSAGLAAVRSRWPHSV